MNEPPEPHEHQQPLESDTPPKRLHRIAVFTVIALAAGGLCVKLGLPWYVVIVFLLVFWFLAAMV